MSEKRCGTCHHYTDTKATYGLCKPLKWLDGVDGLPWWAKRPQLGAQTNVRPDEGVDCPGWREAA